MKNHLQIKKLILSGLFIAMGIALPFLTMQIPQIGSMLLPMHLPMFLAGYICGPYALLVGFVTPILRSAIFGMPPMFPTAIAMSFELAAYAGFTALFYKLLPKKTIHIYTSILLAMLCGRIVWGVSMVLLTSINGGAFSFAAFLGGAFTTALPGIILQIILIPVIIIALRRAGLIDKDEK